MRFSRYSRTVVALAVLGAVVVAGTALAVDVADQDVPSEAKVGDPARATVNMTNLYDDQSQWTLTVETELENPDWTITYYNQTGGVVKTIRKSGQQEVTGSGVSSPISKVQVRVTGTVPEVEEYTYPANHTFMILELVQGTDVIDRWNTFHYTPASREARRALNQAKEAMDAANASGASVDFALNDYQKAVQSYESGSFGVAKDLANSAEQNAKNAREDAMSGDEGSGGPPLALIVIGLLVLVAVVGGGIYYYRQSQQQSTKLR